MWRQKCFSLLRVKEYRILYRRKGEVRITKTGIMTQNWWNHLALIVRIKIGGRAWYRVDEHNSHDGEEEEVKAEVTSYDYFYQIVHGAKPGLYISLDVLQSWADPGSCSSSAYIMIFLLSQ